MSLGGVKGLLSTRHNTSGTYPLILTARILGALQRAAATVGNSGAGIHNVAPDAGNDGICPCGIRTNSRSGCVCIYCEFLLEAESQ